VNWPAWAVSRPLSAERRSDDIKGEPAWAEAGNVFRCVRIEVPNVSIDPIGGAGASSAAQILAEQDILRTQQARATSEANRIDAAQQAILDRQTELEAQMQAQLEAQQRTQDRQEALEAFGIQQARVQDAIRAEQDLQAALELSADEAADRQQSFEQAALDALLSNNGNTTIATVQDALDEFGQFGDAAGTQTAGTQATITASTGSSIDSQL
jgi:hypothetical protein